MSQPDLKQYMKPSFTHWFLAVAFDWGVIVLSFWFAAHWNHPVGYIIAIVVIGARQHGLGLMAHEVTHFNISKNRKLNDLIGGLLCFWPLSYGCDRYREFHWKHHKHLGTDQDPEQEYKKGRYPLWEIPVTRQKVWTNYMTDFFGLSIHELFVVIKSLAPNTTKDVIGIIVVNSAAIGMCYYLDALWIVAMWIFCMATSFWAASRVRIWSEHIGTKGSNRFQANAIEKFFFFPHNTWCHYEHHKWLNAPCHHLPTLRQFDQSQKIYPTFNDLLKSYQ